MVAASVKVRYAYPGVRGRSPQEKYPCGWAFPPFSHGADGLLGHFRMVRTGPHPSLTALGGMRQDGEGWDGARL
eukprot:160835-Chlamydomonas_euryale.AAC.1